jgi:type IV secretory pathway VirB4 component
LETALEDAETLRTELQRGQEKFFQYGLYFTIYSPNEDELRKASKELQSMLAGKLVLSKRADLQMERGFNSTIPICLDEIRCSAT